MTLHTEWKTFPGTSGDCRAYIASLEPVSEPRPTVIVIQEIWGVDRHIQEVANRLAGAGYVAVAPDLFAVNGVHPDTLNEARLAAAKEFLHRLPSSSWHILEDREKAIQAEPADRQEMLRSTLNALFDVLSPARNDIFGDILQDAAAFARNTFEKTKGMPVASVGFCLGGALSSYMAAKEPQHAGSIIFYGRPIHQGIADIQCPVIGFFGGEDPNITNRVPAYEEEMRQHGKLFEAVIYPNAKHAFFNDTNPTFSPKDARDAFARTIEFLNRVTSR